VLRDVASSFSLYERVQVYLREQWICDYPSRLPSRVELKGLGYLSVWRRLVLLQTTRNTTSKNRSVPGPGANARLLLGPRTSSVWLSSSPSSDRRYSEATRQRFVSNTGLKQKVRFTAHTFRSSNEHSKSSETDMTAAKFCRGRCCSAGQPEK
jgi:hypothetical protein